MTLPQNVKDGDPNPLATGPTKWRAERCVTHHHACDCREWEHACEVERLQSRLAAANAQLRLMHRVLSQAVCVACADDGSAKDRELDKLEGVLRDQGWITSAVVPSTPADEHLQGAGDE